jgi:hypothetical protein
MKANEAQTPAPVDKLPKQLMDRLNAIKANANQVAQQAQAQIDSDLTIFLMGKGVMGAKSVDLNWETGEYTLVDKPVPTEASQASPAGTPGT